MALARITTKRVFIESTHYLRSVAGGAERALLGSRIGTLHRVRSPALARRVPKERLESPRRTWWGCAAPNPPAGGRIRSPAYPAHMARSPACNPSPEIGR